MPKWSFRAFGKVRVDSRRGASWHCSYLGTGRRRAEEALWRASKAEKSPEPADKNVGATWRRLSSLRVQATFQSPMSPRTIRIIKNRPKLRPSRGNPLIRISGFGFLSDFGASDFGFRSQRVSPSFCPSCQFLASTTSPL
jgi:hypothetical protein